MKKFLILIVLVAGCDTRHALLTECYSEAAYELMRPTDLPAEKKCCVECKGTGKVKSGDGLSDVSCPCDKSCGCKQTTGCGICGGSGKRLSNDGRAIVRCTCQH